MSRKAATVTKEAQPDLLGGATEPKRGETMNAAKVAAAAKPTKAAAKAKPETIAQPATSKGELAVVKNNPTNTLALIAEALKDPNFKPESMRMVLDMHKEMVAEQARLDFTHAMRELKRKLPAINKDGKIEYKDKGHGAAKLRFASFENIHDVLKPLLDEFGFDLWFSSEPGAAGMMNVIGNLDHESGHARKTILPLPHDSSGGKSGLQGWASAFSSGKRIATIGLLNIQTKAIEDRDLDGHKPKMTKGGKPQVVEGEVVVETGHVTQDKPQIEVCTEDQLIKVRDAIAGCGVSDKTFCGHFKIEKVSQLPAASFNDALAACQSYAEKHK